MSEMFKEINEYIDKRETEGYLDKAVAALLDLKSKHPDNEIICGKLSSAFFYKGLFEKDPKKQELYYEHGTNYGKESITMNPKDVYGNFWYASNVGMLGLCRGIMASLASIEPLRKSMEVVLKENENFYFAGPHRALGRLYHQAPGWPISIGSKSKALEHLEKAVQIAPEFFNNRVFLAELYIDIGKKDKAKEHLEWLSKAEPKQEHKNEDLPYKEKGMQILKSYFG
ncbi:MAG: tetratricopeptide repeat protein [Leptospiraceae bacterium]|nr:tetratricopeptide repeat protein [Leptospiraceae bacterium]MCK6380721.1 tetratricopeptide repeat protein [Leptospiraceae bacterium]NUM41854.1 tetratricopeptide repeat protein [Leptospiraceae bacterium]